MGPRGILPADIASFESASTDVDGGNDSGADAAWDRRPQPWTATTYSLLLLRDFGINPRSEPMRRTVTPVRDNCRWEEGGQRYLDGEVEPCINGMTVALGAYYFGQDVDCVISRLVSGQLDDGGWNCWAESGAVVSSADDQRARGPAGP